MRSHRLHDHATETKLVVVTARYGTAQFGQIAKKKKGNGGSNRHQIAGHRQRQQLRRPITTNIVVKNREQLRSIKLLCLALFGSNSGSASI